MSPGWRARSNLGSSPSGSERLAVAVVGFGIAVLLWYVQDKTRIGAIVRAGMDDPTMTRALGINLNLVVVAVFVLGSAVAGIAGGVRGLVFGAQPDQPMQILLLALIVVVVGGVGSVSGTIFAALLIGLLDSVSRFLFPDMAVVVLYALMVAVLVIRPTGISGRASWSLLGSAFDPHWP